MRRALLATVVLALILVAGLLASGLGRGAGANRTSIDGRGRYRLIDQSGRIFDRASLAGRPYLTYFGYASCPDRCPTMLLRLSRLRKSFGLSSSQLPILFITVDPENDTSHRLAAFVKALNVPVIALTGDQDVINRVTDNAGVFVQVIEQPGGGYRIEHTTKAFVYNRQGDFSETISPTDSDSVAIRKLRGALSAGMAQGLPPPAPSSGPARGPLQVARR